jgi:hypothetical protein
MDPQLYVLTGKLITLVERLIQLVDKKLAE